MADSSRPNPPTPLPAPASLQLLQDTQAQEGQVVVLECRVRGAPPLQVHWVRQGQQIQDSPDFRVLQKSEDCGIVGGLGVMGR